VSKNKIYQIFNFSKKISCVKLGAIFKKYSTNAFQSTGISAIHSLAKDLCSRQSLTGQAND
jgi:hypothetical protein